MHCPINSIRESYFQLECEKNECAWFIPEVEQCAIKFLAYYAVDISAGHAMAIADRITNKGQNDPGEYDALETSSLSR